MKTYKLPQEAIKKQNQKVAFRLGGGLVVVFLGMVVFGWWRGDQNWIGGVICTGMFLAILLFFSFRRGLKNGREIMESFQIEVGEDYIARSQVRASTVSIQRQEIAYVVEGAGGLGVFTADKNRTIGIPSTLDSAEYEEIKQILMTWSTIRPEKTYVNAINPLIFVGIIAGFAIIYFSTSIYLVLITALAVAGFYGYFAWRFRQMEGTDTNLRKQYVVIAVLMVLLFAIRVVYLLV